MHCLCNAYLGCTYPETLYHRDDALLCIAYVMLIWAAPIQRPYIIETMHSYALPM